MNIHQGDEALANIQDVAPAAVFERSVPSSCLGKFDCLSHPSGGIITNEEFRRFATRDVSTDRGLGLTDAEAEELLMLLCQQQQRLSPRDLDALKVESLSELMRPVWLLVWILFLNIYFSIPVLCLPCIMRV